MSSDEISPEADAEVSAGGPRAPAKKSLWGKAKETLGEVSTQATKVAALGTAGAAKTAEVGKQTIDSALATGMQVYAGSKLETAVNFVDGELEQRGAKKAIKDTSGALVGKLDQVTGKRLVELLEEKLRRQDEYNDLLATRLAEALERISKLEARFHEH